MSKDSKQDVTIAEMKKDIGYIKESQERLEKTMTAFIKEANSKFARKWVEKRITAIVWGVFSTIGVAILSFMIYKVLDNIQ